MTREEFTNLSLSYLEEVSAYSRRLCSSEWDADDLVQMAFELAFRNWADLRDPGRCRAWLFRITRNLHIDRVRRLASRAELHLVTSNDSVATPAIVPPETVERLLARELEALLLAVPYEQREAILLSDLWGFSYEEIAEIADAPVGTVRSRIARGRSRLAEAVLGLERRSAPPGGTSTGGKP